MTATAQSTEITVRAVPAMVALSDLAARTPAERLVALIEHRCLVQRIMAEAMQEGVHYGTIKDKDGRPIHPRPTLYDPGALFLMWVFGLRGQPVFEVAEEVLGDVPLFRYVVRYELYHLRSGELAGCGYGAANSHESQWYYRWVAHHELPPGLDPKGLPRRVVRPQKGGQLEVYRVVNPDLPTLQNTIRKQAIVRARRDAVLTVTACKDLFTQDFDEILPETAEAEPVDASVEKAQAEASQAGAPEAEHPPRRITVSPTAPTAPPAESAKKAPRPRGNAQPEKTAAGQATRSGESAPNEAANTPGGPPAASPQGQEKPVLPQEWAALINQASSRGWTHPQIADVYKRVTGGKTLDQRPSREEFTRLTQALSAPPPGAPEPLPF